MQTIHINVKNRVATANGDSRIINGNSDYNIEFDFDAEWADLNNKIGIFAYNDAAAHKWAYQTVMFSGNTCAVPILRDIHCVYVGVTAGNVRVTTPAKVQCRLSISDYADTEEPPSADIWGQILAKLDELQTEIDEIKAGGVGGTDISLGVTGATVGQTVNVKAVDADGKPTAWEAVDMAAGGGAEVYYAELGGEYPSYTLSAETPLADIAKAYAANKSIVCRCEIGGMTATLPLFIPMPRTNTWIFSGAGALGAEYSSQTFTVAITPFGVEAEQRFIAAQTALDAVTATANEAVLYTLQTLGDEQKQQAQKNIGINPEVRNTSMTNPVGVDGYGKLWSKADTSLNVTGATVGQTIKVKAVDANGKPTAWEAVDMAGRDTWERLGILDASSAEVLQLDFPYPVKKLYFSSVLTDSAGEAYSASDKVYRQVAFNVDGTWQNVNGFKIGCCKHAYGLKTRYWLECGADLPTAKGEWSTTLLQGFAPLQLTPFVTATGNNYTKSPVSGIRFSLTLSAAAENTASGSIEVWGVKA